MIIFEMKIKYILLEVGVHEIKGESGGLVCCWEVLDGMSLEDSCVGKWRNG